MSISKKVAEVAVALATNGFEDGALHILEAATKTSAWEGKFATPHARLTWNEYSFILEELPVKGKKKLRRAEVQNPAFRDFHTYNEFLPINIVEYHTKLGKKDSYDQLKKKITESLKKAVALTEEKQGTAPKVYPWREDMVFYLKVTPEDVDLIDAEGEDFTVHSEWTKFGAYSPDSDLQQHDAYYIKYVSKSPAAARKLYKILKANPKALARTTWSEFGHWLTKNKIAYTSEHSTW